MPDMPLQSIVKFLQDIVNVLESSTIVKEKAKDVRPKFWAAYKKVSGEFDDNMLDWCNGNMDTILIFVCEISHFIRHLSNMI
jgi:hypothetical protein